MDLFSQPPRPAVARRADPGTSHDAAAAVTPGLRELQARVEAYARRIGAGGFTDAQMAADLEDTTSTLRTRRAELAARRIVIDTGRRRTWGDSPRLRSVWVHRDFVHEPPAVIDAPVPIKEAREEALIRAATLDSMAATFRERGSTLPADELEASARLLRRLAK
jgi:hypothetical protein